MRDYDIETSTLLDSFSGGSFKTSYEFMDSNLKGMARIMRGYHSAIEAASKSGEYSAEGLRRLKIREGRKALTDLNAKADTLRTLDKRMADIRSSLKPKHKSPEERLEAYLRGREIRDGLRGLDPLELEVVYLQATEHEGFAEVADAIENAPAIPGRAPLLSKEALAQGREIRLLRDNPEDAQTLNEIKTVKSLLDSFYRPSVKELEDVLGMQDDPIAKMAGSRDGSGNNESSLKV
jgi:hypothetical protein